MEAMNIKFKNRKFTPQILINASITSCIFFLVSCGGGSNTDFTPKDEQPILTNRSQLTYETLTQGVDLITQVNMDAFSSIQAPPSNNFEGTLILNGQDLAGSFKQYVGGAVSTDKKHLPEFNFKFVQDGSDIIPVQRGVVTSNNPEWEFILESGKVWNEESDNGFSRIAIPFALQQKNQNCIHNGVMSFLFKTDGTVSKLAYQISSETCLAFKFDMWGLLDANYVPATINNADKIKRDYQVEKDSRMANKPITELVKDYPNINLDLTGFGKGITPEHMTLFGLVIDNTHYVSACNTRQGVYPYCDVLVIPSYSTSKSLFAATALMRLEQKYPGTKDTTISTQVPECSATQTIWDDVTFENTLNMATGNYTSPNYLIDESNSSLFFTALSHDQKINYSCTSWTRQALPGTFWNYHTSDTYILTAAMNNYLQQNEGLDKDIFIDSIVTDIWTPLNISPTAKVTKRTYDVIKQAWGGYGLNLHRDDVAKLANFYNIDNGSIASVQMLDNNLLTQALQKIPNVHGLNTGLGNLYYSNGFWALDAGTILGCNNEVWIPFMSGFGGITIALLPNGMTYYYFSDNDEFSWLAAIIEANKIKSMCQ